MRVGAVLGGVCTVLMAGAAGAGLYSGFGFHAVAAIAVAGAVLAGLGLYHGMSRAIGLRTVVTRQLHDLSRGESDLARQVAQIDRRVADLESRFEAALDRTRVATDPLALELGDLGVLVKELAAKVGVHESALNELVQPQAVQSSRLVLETRPAAPTKPAEPAAAGETPKGGGEEILATVGSGIDGNRGELCLLPIVSLPQRKIRYYEARLGNEPHERLTPADLPAHGKREGAL